MKQAVRSRKLFKSEETEVANRGPSDRLDILAFKEIFQMGRE